MYNGDLMLKIWLVATVLSTGMVCKFLNKRIQSNDCVIQSTKYKIMCYFIINEYVKPEEFTSLGEA